MYSWVSADVGCLSHLPHEITSLVRVCDLVVGDVVGLPFFVVGDCVHEVVGHADAVVRVLKEDRAIGLAVNSPIVARVD